MRLPPSRYGKKTLVHGDDYVPAGSGESSAWLEKELEKAYELKTQKLGDSPGYKLEGKVLNRIFRGTDIRTHH